VPPCESEDKFTASMAPSSKTGKEKTIPSLNIGESTGKNKMEAEFPFNFACVSVYPSIGTGCGA